MIEYRIALLDELIQKYKNDSAINKTDINNLFNKIDDKISKNYELCILGEPKNLIKDNKIKIMQFKKLSMKTKI